MKFKENCIEPYLNIIRFNEYNKYIDKSNNTIVFYYVNLHVFINFYSLILNFSFKKVDFNKKKALAFFLGVEYLTNQKCIATLSSKNILEWKLRKGALVGCKVTLRNINLYDFLDILAVSLPRMEKFMGIRFSNKNRDINNNFAMKLIELILFYPIELGLGINTEVNKLDLNFIFSTSNIDEKCYLLTTYKIPINENL